jgi:hypothetical protein
MLPELRLKTTARSESARPRRIGFAKRAIGLAILLPPMLLTFRVLLAPLTAHVSTATVSSTVADATGAVVPNAKVIATDQSTGVQTQANSNGAGQYTLQFLKPATYTLNLSVKGFKKFDEENLALSSGDQPTIDISLALRVTSDTVEVSATPPLLGTQDACLGEVVPEPLVENLPLGGRTPMSFTQYTVGVVATTKPVGYASVRQLRSGRIFGGWSAQQELRNSNRWFARQRVRQRLPMNCRLMLPRR